MTSLVEIAEILIFVALNGEFQSKAALFVAVKREIIAALLNKMINLYCFFFLCFTINEAEKRSNFTVLTVKYGF